MAALTTVSLGYTNTSKAPSQVVRVPAPSAMETIVYQTGGRQFVTERISVFKLANVSVERQILVSYIPITKRRSTERSDMKSLLVLDARDISFMFGLGSLSGASVNLFFNAVFNAPAPHAAAIAFTTAGFLGGRLVSVALRRNGHG